MYTVDDFVDILIISTSAIIFLYFVLPIALVSTDHEN